MFSFFSIVAVNIAALFFHLLLLDDAVHVVIDGQVLQLLGVISFVEHQLELIVHRVRALVTLLWRYGRRWEYRVNCDPTEL